MMTERRRPAQALAIAGTLAMLLALMQAAAFPTTVPAQSLVATIQLPEEGHAVSVDPLTGLGYVGMTDDLGVFDLDSYEYLNAIQLYSQGPITVEPVAVNPCTNKLYTGGRVVDLASNAVVSLPAGGSDIAINQQTNMIYLGYEARYVDEPDLVTVVDGATNRHVGAIVLGSSWWLRRVRVAVNPVTNLVYATYSGENHLHVISGVSNTEIAKVPIPGIGRVAVNPVTNRVYVVSGGSTVVLDGSTLAELGRIDNFGGYLLVNPFNNLIYSLAGAGLRVADGSTNQVVRTLNLPGGAVGPALDPLRGRIYLACAYAGWRDKLTVIQDVPAPPGATLACPAVWRVYLPVVLKVS